jgi:hypothetical protein
MTSPARRSLAAALSGHHPDLLRQRNVTRASHGVALCLVAAMLAAGLLARANTTTGPTHSAAVARGIVTDPPVPAYVMRLERDPFR